MGGAAQADPALSFWARVPFHRHSSVGGNSAKDAAWAPAFAGETKRWTSAGMPPATALPWLNSARRAALALQASSRGKRGVGHSVYVALLHDPRLGERWGLYVGQTGLDPDLRFDQHKAGYKASSAVKRFGVRLMPDLVEHLNPMAVLGALDLEAALADAFRAAGVPWVEGGH